MVEWKQTVRGIFFRKQTTTTAWLQNMNLKIHFKDIENDKHFPLIGHRNNLTCLTVSKEEFEHFLVSLYFIHPPPFPLKERWNLILLRSFRGAPFLKEYIFSPRAKSIFNDLKIFKISRTFQNVRILMIALWFFKISPFLRCERSVTLEIDVICLNRFLFLHTFFRINKSAKDGQFPGIMAMVPQLLYGTTPLTKGSKF